MTHLEAVFDFCEKNYPEHKPIEVCKGAIIIIYLRHPESDRQNKDLTVYYRVWYTSEFNISKITPIKEEKEVIINDRKG